MNVMIETSMSVKGVFFLIQQHIALSIAGHSMSYIVMLPMRTLPTISTGFLLGSFEGPASCLAQEYEASVNLRLGVIYLALSLYCKNDKVWTQFVLNLSIAQSRPASEFCEDVFSSFCVIQS